MCTVQTKSTNKIENAPTGKFLLSYRYEYPTAGSAIHNSQHWVQNKRTWNLRACCEVKWKRGWREKESHLARHGVIRRVLRRSGSQELEVAGVCQVNAGNLCLLHLQTLLPETAAQIRQSPLSCPLTSVCHVGVSVKTFCFKFVFYLNRKEQNVSGKRCKELSMKAYHLQHVLHIFKI